VSPWPLAVVESQSAKMFTGPHDSPRSSTAGGSCGIQWFGTQRAHTHNWATVLRALRPPKGHWGSTQHDLGAAEEGAHTSPQPLAIAKSQSTEMLMGPHDSLARGVMGINCASLWSLAHAEVEMV